MTGGIREPSKIETGEEDFIERHFYFLLLITLVFGGLIMWIAWWLLL